MGMPAGPHGYGAAIGAASLALSAGSFWIDPAAVRGEVIALLAVLSFASAAWAMAVWRQARHPERWRLRDILLWAAAFRIILLPGLPVLETDWNRYLWDGFVVTQGVNPHRFAPAQILNPEFDAYLGGKDREAVRSLRAAMERHPRGREILSGVNNAGVNTIYPPFTQILFAAAAWTAPFSVYAWRAVIILFDALLIAAILAILRTMGRPESWVIVYAWSPLVLKEYINTLHYDCVTLALAFWAMALALKGANYRAAPAWACAVQSKFFPLLLLPHWHGRRDWKPLALALALAAALAVPFMGGGPAGASGFAVFAQRWESNASLVIAAERAFEWLGVPPWGEGTTLFVWAGVPFALDAFLAAKAACGAAFLAFTARIWWKCVYTRGGPADRMRASAWTLAALILLGPVANPWYIAWMVPFLCLVPSAAWMYLCSSCFLYYTFFIPDPRGYPPGARELEYLPFFALLLWEWRRGKSGAPPGFGLRKNSGPTRAGAPSARH